MCEHVGGIHESKTETQRQVSWPVVVASGWNDSQKVVSRETNSNECVPELK